MWLSVCLLWKIDLKRRVFLFFFLFFLIGAFLWAVLKAIEENRARGRRLEEVEAVVCAAAAPAWGLFFFFVYIAMIVICTMWLDG